MLPHRPGNRQRMQRTQGRWSRGGGIYGALDLLQGSLHVTGQGASEGPLRWRVRQNQVINASAGPGEFLGLCPKLRFTAVGGVVRLASHACGYRIAIVLFNRMASRSMLIRAGCMALLLPMPAALLRAQAGPPPVSASQGSFLDDLRKDVHFYGSSIYGSYETGGTAATPAARERTDGGISASIGWRHITWRSDLSLTYTTMYSRQFHDTGMNSLSQVASFQANRTISPIWTLAVRASGQVLNLTDTLFLPGAEAQSLASPTSTGTPVPVVTDGISAAPLGLSAHALFRSDRLLDANLSVTAARRYSPRRTLSLAAIANRIQNLESHQASTSAVPTVTTAGATAGIAYEYSERTKLGLSTSALRVLTAASPSYATTLTGSFSRELLERWSLEAHGGVGGIFATGAASRGVSGAQYIAGGGVRRRSEYQSLSISVDHNLLSAYNYGSGAVWTGTTAWNWSRPNRPWSCFLNGGAQRIQFSAVPQAIESYQGSAGVTRRLSRILRLNLSYTVLRASAQASGARQQWWTQGLRLAFEWIPGPAVF